MHRCEEWTRWGINCPGGLLDAREGLQEEPTDDELQPSGDKLNPILLPPRRHKKANVNTALASFQLAVLLEVSRQMLVDEAIGRLPPQVKVPVELVREAVRQGARGKQLALWIAAAAALGAVGLKLGPGPAAAVSSLIRPSGGGGIGFTFRAPDFRNLVKKRVQGFITSAGGEFFPGILG